MKNKILLLFLSFLFLSKLFAQPYTETFESFSPPNSPATSSLNSFTNNSQTFNLSQVGSIDATKFSITKYGTGSGYGPSDNYIDNHSSTGVGSTYSIKTSGGQLFSIKRLYLFVSRDAGLTVGGTGTIDVSLLKSGSSIASFSLSNSYFLTNFNSPNLGFTLVDFVSAGGSNNSLLPIDEIRFTLTSGYNYIAVDNFTWSPASQWSGTTNTTFSTSTNWVGSNPPTSTSEIYIPSTSNNPNLTSAASCTNLTILSGASLTVGSGGSLNISGSISNAGTFNASAGTVGFTGSSAQTIAANAFVSNTINNLTINNSAGVTLAGTLNVTGTLTPTAGTFTTGGFLTLKSTSIANTAEVGVVGGTISGNVTVERFIPAKRAYRLLASGVTTSTSINANWQEGTNNPNTSTNNNPNAGYGTHITGGTSGNGFDVTTTNNPSLFTFNSGTQAWAAIANTNATTLSATTGYRILIRGDRSVSLNTNTPTATNTTLRATGALTTGTVNFTGISGTTNNYTLLGNPYWAGVDWTAVTRTNLSTTYWIWDPTIAGTNGRGGYTSFTRTGVGTGTTSGGGNINKNIQPGQAFFVQTTGASPALSFAEANKDIVTAFTNTFRTQQGNTSGTNGLYVIKLFLQENYTQGLMADAATLAFSSQFSNSKDEFDATKLENPDESIGFKNGKDFFGMESRALPTSTDTAYIQLGNMLSKNYVLEVEGKDFDANATISAYLVDNYLHTQTLLKNTGSVQIPYVIDNNAASAASNRFIIVTSKKAFPSLVSSGDVNIKVSPNPSTDVAVISYSAKTKGATTIRVVNTYGQVVVSLNLGEQQTGQYSLPVSKLAAGQYVVEVTVGEEKITSQFVKQ
jgi:hypothetical protein